MKYLMVLLLLVGSASVYADQSQKKVCAGTAKVCKVTKNG